jgi:hypothetical protein
MFSEGFVANRFGIAFHDEQALRERDKTCVYCHKAMRTFPEIKAGRGVRKDLATIEHLNFDEPFYVKDGLQIEHIVICCAACNSSRRDRRLWDWFKSAYCAGRNINPDTVAEPVQKYLREFPHDLKQFIESAPWTFAKTFAETWPHEYLVRDRVNEALFVCLARHIYRHGYEGRFYEMTYIYFDYGEHTYWNMENVINRCLTSETYDRRTKEGRLPTAEKSSGDDERKVGC